MAHGFEDVRKWHDGFLTFERFFPEPEAADIRLVQFPKCSLRMAGKLVNEHIHSRTDHPVQPLYEAVELDAPYRCGVDDLIPGSIGEL